MKSSKGIWRFLLAPLVFLHIPGNAGAFSNLYVLGDSLSDVGNVFIATGSSPLNSFLPVPLPQDPPYFDGRFSDGPIYAEYLWQSLGLPGDLKPSLGGGTDYAFGGARSRYHAFDLAFNPAFDPVNTPSSFLPFSLLGQRNALLANTGGTLDPDALYTVWEGSNDVADAFEIWLGGNPADAQALIQQAAGDIVAVIADPATGLVAAGAKNLLVPNVPNLGLAPEVVALGPGAQALASSLAGQLNDLVDAGLVGLAADIVRLDTFSFLTELIGNPNSAGLTNVTEGCFTGYVGVPGTVCSNPDEYAFWDRLHPSAVTHREIGGVASLAVPEPASLVVMALGLLGMGFSRRNNATG